MEDKEIAGENGSRDRPFLEQVNIGDELLVKAPFHERTNETWNVIVVGINKQSKYPFQIEVKGDCEGRRDFEMMEETIIKIIRRDQ